MKQKFCFFAFLVVLTSSFLSCRNTATYAELLADERTSINSFMTKRGYTVTDTIPTQVPWPDKLFYKTKSGLYIHVIDTGTCVIDSIPKNTEISVRYSERDMNDSLKFENMYSSVAPSLIYYKYISPNTKYEDCLAWHEALDFVGDKGRVYLIVPSKLGWSVYSDAVTAHFYELRYSFWK